MIERHHLALLKEIHERGTLTEAARNLCLTQSALSHTLKKLETQLNTPLLVKEGRRLRFTPAGNHLLKLGDRILPQFEHAEVMVKQIANGQRGSLRIGMECHPCYQWLLRVVAPYLEKWPDVDLDVIQKFKFGGLGALLAHDIDLLVTPDPVLREGLIYYPVFDYEQVLVVRRGHPLEDVPFIQPEMLSDATLVTYPVESSRLDIFQQFLAPANVLPKKHKHIEATDILLQMVAAGRGVTALPAWLVEDYTERLEIGAVRLGRRGLHKQIFLGIREADAEIEYLKDFREMAEVQSQSTA